MNATNNQLLIEKLRGLGIHVTKTRIFVLQMLIEKKFALSVFDINRFSGGNLDRVSVYRTFQEFLQKGIVKKVPNNNGEIKYLLDLKKNNSVEIKQYPAVYFCCTGCGTVTEICEVKIPNIELFLNVGVKRSHLLVEGLCKNCVPTVL